MLPEKCILKLEPLDPYECFDNFQVKWDTVGGEDDLDMKLKTRLITTVRHSYLIYPDDELTTSQCDRLMELMEQCKGTVLADDQANFDKFANAKDLLFDPYLRRITIESSKCHCAKIVQQSIGH